MAYYNPPQDHQQKQGNNPGPYGDLGGLQSNSGPPLHPPYSLAQRNGLNPPLPQSTSRASSDGPDSINGETDSNFPVGSSTARPKAAGRYAHQPPMTQSYNVPPPSINSANYPPLNTPYYGASQSLASHHIQQSSTTSGHHLHPPPSSNQFQSSPSTINQQAFLPPTSAPLKATHGQSMPPLHGSQPTQNMVQSQGAGPPPLPGQQFTSSTPPPGAPSRHSPASQLQGQNISSSRSTPTHVSNAPSRNWNAMQTHSLNQSTYNQTQMHSIGSQPPPPVPMQSIPSQSYSASAGPPGPPSSLQPPHGGLVPPPLPGQTYIPRSQSLLPPPLPGQVNSQQPQTSPSKTQAPIVPPPLPGQSYAPLTHSASPMSQASAIPPPTGQQPPSQPPRPGQGAYPGSMQNLSGNMASMGINEAHRPVNLVQEQRILPNRKLVENPLRFETSCDRGVLIPPNRKNCHPDVLRCTLKALPHTQSLLNKVKLPLGLVIHPFKDLSSLPVMSAGTIVRCKRCRTYINPFVSFVDERRWRCNMCFAVNDTPEEFLHHPISKTYGEPHTRPECTNSTIEFIAPQEYMLRPPQPAVYLFLLDVSHSAIETGYLQIVCEALLDHIDRLPGDNRTRIGFLSYNRTVHFYRLNDGLSQPQMMIVSDIDDVFVPTPENLLVNLRESKELVLGLLNQLPSLHTVDAEGEMDTYSALGAALEVAKILMAPSGGRVTVFQQALPSIGPGKVDSREDPNARAGDMPTSLLNPASDFYKKMALDCSAHQVAIDFFFFNSHYIDIATLSCASRYSAGDLHYYPALHTVHNPMEAERLSRDLERYLTRKIGFESVMRIRCTKGLSVHTFHGNFFVRSTDLLSLANVGPDSGFAVNLAIEDSLTELSAVCFQAALLYTTSKGERRIRVHTMCVPVVKTPAEVFNSVDCVAVVSLLSKMAVDRSVTSSLSDARDALVNAVIDPMKMYKDTLPQGATTGGVYVPPCMRLLPLYVHCMLKHPAFRSAVSTRLDDRVFSMINFKMQPALYFLQDIHPDLYRVDDLTDEKCVTISNREVPLPSLLPLSAESLSMSGSFLLDCGWRMYLLVGRNTDQGFINDVLGYPQFSSIEDPMYSIPERENSASELFQSFMEHLQDSRPHYAPIRVIRDDSRERLIFHSYLRQDRTESSMSLQEFLLHIKGQLNK